jgi:putative ABC transport system permease protein
MRWRQELSFIIRRVIHRRRAERELDEEIRAHLEMEVERNVADGMSPEEARTAALRSFGSVALSKEDSRAMWGLGSLEIFWQDLRYGVRMLLKNPGFTTIAVLTLALGIGANTAIFSVINVLLLRSLPFAEADRLVTIWETHPDIPRAPVSIPDFQDWRAQAQSFEEMAVHSDRYRNATLTGQGEPAQVQGSFISQNLFPLLGLKPLLGRNFLPEEEQRGANRVVILSHALWRRIFAGDPGVVGKSVQLNGGAFTVVGVMGEQYPLDMDVWLPLSHLSAEDFTTRRHHRLSVIGRLKPGVTIEQARGEMEAISARLQQAYPASNKNVSVGLAPLRNQLVGNLRPVVLLIFASVALVLLIACVNVSNLLLAQAEGRRREFALRAALGAGRGRLARQLLLESMLLSLLGGGAGLALAIWSMPLLRAGLLEMAETKVPGLETIELDPVTLAFTFGVSLLAGVLFGMLPATQSSRVDLNQALKECGKSSAGVKRRNLSHALVVAEVALAAVVLVGAGLLVRSLNRLLQVDPGFRADHLLSLKISLPPMRYSGSQQADEQVNNFYRQLTQRIQALPGVEMAATIDQLPLARSGAVVGFWAEGRQPDTGKEPIMQMRSVDHRFFDLMRIPLLSGRFFSEAEIASNPRSYVIVNETLARRFFPHQDPVGKRIFVRGPRNEPIAFPVIGVVADIKDVGLDAPVEPETYFPGTGREAVLLARTTVDPLSLAPAVRQSALSIEPALSLPQARSVEEILGASYARRRLAAGLLSVFALLALLLAAVGIYGVVAYSVTQRAQEIGVRMALGAQASDVLKLVIGRGIVPVSLGLAFGLAGAFALSRSLTRLTAGLLFEVRATDPATFTAIALLLMVVALLACYLPARRGTKVDPLAALKHE